MNIDYKSLLSNVKKIKPLVHQITNYVTVKDCANITLAIGASPIMADAIGEAGDIASISSSLVINMGTLNERTIPSMIAAGKAAEKSGIPIVFDPVGAGASEMRNETSKKIISEIPLAVIRGNISEMRYIAGVSSSTKGVDASEDDISSNCQSSELAKSLAQKLNTVVVISGKEDIVSDGTTTIEILNGHHMLSSITGTGCMSSSLVGSFCGANRDDIFSSAVLGQAVMSIGGDIAYEKAGSMGTGSFLMALMDAVSTMDSDTIEKRIRINEL